MDQVRDFGKSGAMILSDRAWRFGRVRRV